MKAPVSREELDAIAEYLSQCPEVGDIHTVEFAGNAHIQGKLTSGAMLIVTSSKEIITEKWEAHA